MAMHIRRFYLKGDGKVFDVYLRPSLIALGVGYDLRIACRNLRKENRVEAIVSGVDENIQQFWEYVKEHDVRPVGNKKSYTVSEIEPYEGAEPDWTYHMSASTMEQITKGVASLDQISKGVASLETINTSMVGVNKSLEGVNTRLESVDKSLGGVNTRLEGVDKSLGSANTRLESVDKSLEGVNTRLGSIDKTLHQIGDKFGKMEDRFGEIGSYTKRMDEKLGSMSGKLDTLPERIAEALSERKPRRPRQKSK